eukprot:scaffold280832_cov35-Tisochrysis_lutea.AAC.1
MNSLGWDHQALGRGRVGAWALQTRRLVAARLQMLRITANTGLLHLCTLESDRGGLIDTSADAWQRHLSIRWAQQRAQRLPCGRSGARPLRWSRSSTQTSFLAWREPRRRVALGRGRGDLPMWMTSRSLRPNRRAPSALARTRGGPWAQDSCRARCHRAAEHTLGGSTHLCCQTNQSKIEEGQGPVFYATSLVRR